MKALKGVGCVVYGIAGLMQLAAIYAGLEDWLHIPWWLSAIIGFTVAGLPIIGTVAGIMGAIKGWGWSVWGALALFGWPFILYGVVLAGGGVADLWSRVFKRRRNSDAAPHADWSSTPSDAKPRTMRMSKFVYVALVTVLWVVGSITASVGQVMTKEVTNSEAAADPWVALGVFGCGGLAMLAAWILTFVCLHRACGTIQDGFARTTPGKAVGLMFVPLFNYYWVFQSFWGFAKDYNAHLDRYQSPLPRIATWPYLVFAISFVGLSALAAPLVGSMAWISCCVFLPVVTNSMCNSVNRIADTTTESDQSCQVL